MQPSSDQYIRKMSIDTVNAQIYFSFNKSEGLSLLKQNLVSQEPKRVALLNR